MNLAVAPLILSSAIFFPQLLRADDQSILNEAVADMARSRFDSILHQPIIKWTETIVYGAMVFEPHHEAAVVDRLIPEVSKAVKAIRDATGIDYQFLPNLDEDRPVRMFTLVGTPDEVINLSDALEQRVKFVGLTAELERMRHNGEAVCSLAATWTEDYSIEAVAIVLDLDNDLERCVIEMFLSSVGLPGSPQSTEHEGKVPNFEDGSIDPIDQAALRLFYSDRFEAGSLN